MGVHDCRLISAAVNRDERGVLTALQAGTDLPFEPRRVFFLTDVRAGAERGDHAHRLQSQALVCVQGQVDVRLDDGREVRELELPADGSVLLVEPMIWVTLSHFPPHAVVAVLLSDCFDPAEFVRDYQEFRSLQGL